MKPAAEVDFGSQDFVPFGAAFDEQLAFVVPDS
jgi:hypothetical protein